MPLVTAVRTGLRRGARAFGTGALLIGVGFAYLFFLAFSLLVAARELRRQRAARASEADKAPAEGSDRSGV
jgi:threonine/homoserine/homoserine lactone efflux protein